jgi:uncharacterized protein with von Willebrand factor type A (vWA) domain
MQMLRGRKYKILTTYETERVQEEARKQYHDFANQLRPPPKLTRRYQESVREEQLRDLEQLWYSADEHSPFARQLLKLVERLGDKYQIDELAAKYDFTGHTAMTIPEALEIKEELETIDRLLKQLEEAAQTGQIGIIDLEELAEFAEPGDIEQLSALQQQIQDYLREMAERQGLEQSGQGFQLTPKAYRLFQSRLLTEIFSALQASRSGRHQGPVVGEGAIEMQRTKSYEFGDSVTHMDIPASMLNAMVRNGPGLPIRLKPDDIEIHRTRNNPKCATAVLLDMSGSMRYGGLYVNVKRMGLALDGLIKSEYPARPAVVPQVLVDSRYAQSPDHHDHRWSTNGPFRKRNALPAIPSAPAYRVGDPAGSAALRPRRDHYQYLSALQLESDGGGRALCVPSRGVDTRASLLQRRSRPGSVRRLGLYLPATPNHFVTAGGASGR